MRTMRRPGALGLLLLVAACDRAPSTPASAEPEPAKPIVEYVTQQEILTPLPLRVRLPARYRADRVVVFFHTWGSRDWGLQELSRSGQTWSGEVSCREVSTVTGDTRYFFLAFDPEGEVVVGSGSPDWPHVATIVGSLNDGPTSLEGQLPPLRCHDPADCPPDFPGCPPYALVRPPCHWDSDCTGGDHCAWDGYCGPASSDEEPIMVVSIEERLARAINRVKERYKAAHR